MKQLTYHILLVLAGMSLSTNIEGQTLDLPSIHIAKSLVNAGIDTVVIYSPCNANYVPRYTDSSVVDEVGYVITKRGDLLNIERLTSEFKGGSGRFYTHNFILKKDSLGIFSFLNQHFKSVVGDTLLPGMIKYNIDGKDTIVRFRPSHACGWELTVVTAHGTYRNTMYDIDLVDGAVRNQDGTIRWRDESINYAHNISTSIFKIISMLEKLEQEIQKIYMH